MGAYWLFDLPDVIAASGLEVDVWPGWESRSRGSGGYDAVWAVFVHHTASSTTLQNDCSYMWNSTSGDQPIGALYLARDGLVVVGAAGATNCQGSGGPYEVTNGTIPKDKGNAYGIAIEAANNGVGEPWPRAQQDAYVILCATLCAAYDLNPADDIVAHYEWTSRKIDPAGPSDWAFGAASWDMGEFRDACVDDLAPIPTPTPPTPPPEEDDVTDDDIERIAKRSAEVMWGWMIEDPTVAKKIPAWQLLGYTRGAAAHASANTDQLLEEGSS